jgi:hypothetical protein
MRVKELFLLGLFWLVISFLSTPVLLGQVGEVELTRAVIQTQRQAIIAENLELTEAEATLFWPLYRDFRAEMAKLGDRTVKVIMTFADNYEDLSNETAEWLITEALAVEQAKADLKTSWLPRFKEVLPAKKVARYFQIENKLDAIVNYDLAANIPLVE